MDVRKLRKIVELLDEFDIADFKLKEEQSSVQITRKPQITSIQPQTGSNFNFSNGQPESNQSTEFGSDQTKNNPPSFVNKDQKNINLDDSTDIASYSDEKLIKSPMVGTFYSAASPDSDDFVTKGQKIKMGNVVCIVEAMKIMNRIEADKEGVVKQVLIKNGEPVEFGQPLVVLD